MGREVGLPGEATAAHGALLPGRRQGLVTQEGRVHEDEIAGWPAPGERVAAPDVVFRAEQVEPERRGQGRERGQVEPEEPEPSPGPGGEQFRRGEQRTAAAGRVEHPEAIEGGAQRGRHRRLPEERGHAIGSGRTAVPGSRRGQSEGGQHASISTAREDRSARAGQSPGQESLQDPAVERAAPRGALVADRDAGEKERPPPGQVQGHLAEGSSGPDAGEPIQRAGQRGVDLGELRGGARQARHSTPWRDRDRYRPLSPPWRGSGEGARGG